ncbi:hypothetical protein [Haloechinothrix sp. LS1_15]|uniref:hypothetical protein n=1 Tax=Haloechinothrix sp. LS1_15 TaxID=2652248 RepID=UPI002948ADE5|nr:hypothetical protein [Haloechinothrix sp. LS1_15]MDV6011871.1 hypothetical protein [Haloechinothrix sp. LS1_15]
MVEPITANYVEESEDWSVTVTGVGRELSARAPGLIAARDRAEQLVDKLEPDQEKRAVVHMLNGSAVDFTVKYMEARIARTVATDGEGNITDASIDADSRDRSDESDGSDTGEQDVAFATESASPDVPEQASDLSEQANQVTEQRQSEFSA